MNKLKPYTKYKPSGIAWLGDIPEHWEVRKLKYSLNINNGSDYKHIQSNSGFPVIGSGGQFAYAKEFMFDGEVVFLGRKGTIDKPLYFKGKFWAVDTMFYANGKNGNNVKFHYYVSTQIPFRLYSTSTALPSMTQTDLKEHYLAYPSIPEQTAIANFLDYKTAKIDRFIAKKKRLIKLLNEQKSAIINDAVTKGLNPNVKMKPSGIEWLGNIPEHWEVRKLKYVAKICNGSDCDKQPEGKYPVYGSGGIFGWNEHFIYDKPSVLLGRKGTIDKPILVYEPFWTVDTAFYTKIKIEVIDILFFYYLCCNIPFQYYSSKTALPSMTQTSLYHVNFTVPPLEEQKAIVQYIEQETAQINTIIQTIEKEITLVQEYRTALIAEAVTGKIDVRDYEIAEVLEENTYEDWEQELNIAAEEETEYHKQEME